MNRLKVCALAVACIIPMVAHAAPGESVQPTKSSLSKPKDMGRGIKATKPTKAKPKKSKTALQKPKDKNRGIKATKPTKPARKNSKGAIQKPKDKNRGIKATKPTKPARKNSKGAIQKPKDKNRGIKATKPTKPARKNSKGAIQKPKDKNRGIKATKTRPGTRPQPKSTKRPARMDRGVKALPKGSKGATISPCRIADRLCQSVPTKACKSQMRKATTLLGQANKICSKVYRSLGGKNAPKRKNQFSKFVVSKKSLNRNPTVCAQTTRLAQKKRDKKAMLKLREASRLYRQRTSLCRKAVQGIFKVKEKQKQKLPKKWWVKAFQTKGAKGKASADAQAAADAARAISLGRDKQNPKPTVEEQYAE